MIRPDPHGTPEQQAEYRRLVEKDRQAVAEQFGVKPDLVLDTTLEDVDWLKQRRERQTKK